MPPALPCRAHPGQFRLKFSAAAAAFIFSQGVAFSADPVLPQREQAERTRLPDLTRAETATERKPPAEIPASATDDDAFGAQLILKERIRQKYFQVFGDVGAFHTSNVALSRSDAHSDAFLNAAAGLGWRRAINDRLSLAISGRYTLFRYSRFSVLDFQSAETDVTLGIRLPADWEFTIGYGFTQLNSRTDSAEFYHEHSINVGFQRIFPLNDANALVVGLGPTWSWADPQAAQRDKYAAYLGWRWRATERLSTMLLYRYGYYVYREGNTGRRDHNQTASLSVRYDATDWLSLTASGFGTWNRSNQSAFDYDAWNLGGSIGVNARF